MAKQCSICKGECRGEKQHLKMKASKKMMSKKDKD